MRIFQCICLLSLFLVGAAREQLRQGSQAKNDAVFVWSTKATDCIRVDFSGEVASKDQGSPNKGARANAIVHMAIFDAVNCIQGDPQASFAASSLASAKKASVASAVASAAVNTLKALYPSQQEELDAYYNSFMKSLDTSAYSTKKGIEVGELCADATLKSRQGDGSDIFMEYTPTGERGNHKVDPFNLNQGYADPQFAQVKPFVLENPSQFRAKDHSCLDLKSDKYTKEFNYLKSIGSKDSKTRTDDQLLMGLFWAYDGAQGIGTPVRQLMQIAHQVTENMQLTSYELARIYVLGATAAVDASIASWESKYYYQFWRPVVAIHEANSDGNPDTKADESWEPYGAPKSNSIAEYNFTPNFPTYTSGHSAFAGAFFKMLYLALGGDVSFTFMSDETNGITTDHAGLVREKHERSFTTFRQAAQEMAYGRVYLGIHWACDCSEGLEQGEKIAQYIFNKVNI